MCKYTQLFFFNLKKFYFYISSYLNYNFVQNKFFFHSPRASVITASVNKISTLSTIPVYLSLTQNITIKNCNKIFYASNQNLPTLTYYQNLFFFKNNMFNIIPPKRYNFKLHFGQPIQQNNFNLLFRNFYFQKIINKFLFLYLILSFKKSITYPLFKFKKIFTFVNKKQKIILLKRRYWNKFFFHTYIKKYKYISNNFFNNLKKLKFQNKLFFKLFSNRFLKLKLQNKFVKQYPLINDTKYFISNIFDSTQTLFYQFSNFNHKFFLMLLFLNPILFIQIRVNTLKFLLTSLFSISPQLQLYQQVNYSNLFPHKKFSYIFSKQLSSLFSMNKIREDIVPLIYHTLVRFVEHISGKKFLFQFYPFLNQNITKNYVIRYKS